MNTQYTPDANTLEIMKGREVEWSQTDQVTNQPKLRPYQDSAIKQLIQTLGKGMRRPVLQMATGGGKTLTIAEIIRRAEEKGNRTLFICDSLELVEQAVAAFDSYGLQVGVMQADHYRTDESCLTQVCTAQTLDRRVESHRLEFERYPVALVIYDECHVQYAVREVIAQLYPKAPIIGLTATPFSKGMGTFYNAVVSAVPMQGLIDQGYLCPFTAYAPFVPDMKGVKRAGSDYSKDAAAAIYNSELVADIVQTWMKHGKGRPTLAFACNVAHSKFIAEQFVNAGVNAVHVDGYGGSDEEKAERHAKIQAYKNGEVEILSSVGICTKGFDAPATACLIVARPTKSLSLHWQIVGRALRTHPSKAEAIILDHAGNFVRHGFPTDPIDFELNDGEKSEAKTDSRKTGEKLPVPCGACGMLKTGHKCPGCGFAPERQNTIENVDGELVRLDQLEAREKKTTYTKEEKQQWYSEIRGHAKAKGKTDGWVSHTYREKFGVWPQGLSAVLLEPSNEVTGFIKHRQIAYAKSKAARS